MSSFSGSKDSTLHATDALATLGRHTSDSLAVVGSLEAGTTGYSLVERIRTPTSTLGSYPGCRGPEVAYTTVVAQSPYYSSVPR